jgi:putative copper resistance protein D
MTAVMILFGSSLFPFYAGSGTLDRTLPAFPAGLRPILLAASVLALVSALLWLALEAGEMGDDPADAVNPDTLLLVLTATGFGAVWQFHLALCLALVAVVARSPPARRPGLVLLLAALLLASQAWVGHGVMATGAEGTLRLANQTIHLIAAAAWLGGLVPLARVLDQARRDPTRSALAIRVLRSFSAMALGAVALLVLSGLVNGWFLVGSPEALVATPYGQVLILKLVLFLGLLALAAVNRLSLLPRLTAAADPGSTLTALFRTVLAEQGLGLALLGVASVLGTLAPAIDGLTHQGGFAP